MQQAGLQVLQYDCSKIVSMTLAAFRSEAIDNERRAQGGDAARKLFLMILDECHYAVPAGGPVDQIVNDFNNPECRFIEQENVHRIFVSATPAAVLTQASHILLQYYKHAAPPSGSDRPVHAALNQLPLYDVLSAETQSVSLVLLAWKLRLLHGEAYQLFLYSQMPSRPVDALGSLQVDHYVTWLAS